MAVIHILKDGRIVDDISGFVVKMEDAAPLYDLMRRINNEYLKSGAVSEARKEKGA